jgi:hypothetical protein
MDICGLCLTNYYAHNRAPNNAATSKAKTIALKKRKNILFCLSCQLVRFRVRFSHSSHWLCSHPDLACLTSLSPASVSHQLTFRAACLVSQFLYYPQVALACLRSSRSVVISQSLHNSEPCLDILRCLLIPRIRLCQRFSPYLHS